MEKVNPLDLEPVVVRLGGIEAVLDTARAAADSVEGIPDASLGRLFQLLSAEVEETRGEVVRFMDAARGR